MAVWSIVDFATVVAPLRYDAEYWRPEFVAFDKRASSSGGSIKKFILRVIQPPEFIREYDSAPGNPEFWRTQNVKRGFIDRSTASFIDPEIFASIRNAQVQEGDILVVRTGANAGDTATVPAGMKQVAVSSHTLRIVPQSVTIGYALGMFFASNLGRSILNRVISGSTRPQITKEMIESLVIPDLSPIAEELANRTRQYYEVKNHSVALYNEAEALLLHELGLDRLELPTAKTYTAPFAEVMAIGRMDAEFFRPQHRFILDHLRGKFDARSLGDLGIVTKGKTPAEYVEAGVPVVRSGDLSDIDATADFLRANPADVRFELQPGDILISSIGFGSIGKVQVFNSAERHTTVNEVTVVRQSVLNPYYLRTFLASPLGQIQIESWVTGATGQLHLNSKDVMKVVVPMLPAVVQAKFEALYVEAQRLKLEAVELLAAAQRRVEEFIGTV